jgi:hypothetical protein
VAAPNDRRRARHTWPAGAAALACAAAACANLSGLSGGSDAGADRSSPPAREASTPDAGRTVDATADVTHAPDVHAHVDSGADVAEDVAHKVDAARADAPITPPPDASHLVDASHPADVSHPLEASMPADAGTDAEWCSVQHTPRFFCDDFDLGVAVSTGWAGVNQYGATNTLTRESTRVVSPPFAALASLPPLDGGVSSASLYTYLWVTPMALPPTLTCELEVFPASFSTTPNDVISWLSFVFFASPDGGLLSEAETLTLTCDSGGNIQFDEFDAYAPQGSVGHLAPSPILPGQWLHVKLTLSNMAGQTGYSVSIGALPLTAGTLTRTLPATSQVELAIGMGDTSQRGSSGWSFDYDNVVCY